ncbi:MAG: DUF501 domain-containing protein [Synergistetes bacterium]|nr:MAG: Uncharacterized protein XD52_0592 [bacterium 42_11]MBC7332226.1 DUF501 domain-containing protein [Synergistota bacterium]MDK2871943.1 uncharacterized protein [bacterium]
MYLGGSGYLKDLEIVRKQIRKRISGFLKVSRRCRWGYPQVIMCYPLKEGKPFPTLYWLTCPYLNKCIGELESKGVILSLAKKVQDDIGIRRRLERANNEYARMRFSLLSDSIKEFLREKFPSYLESIRDRGIGGVSSTEGIKCLHAHLAYSLAGGETPVGEEVLKLLPSVECLDSPKCAMIESCR